MHLAGVQNHQHIFFLSLDTFKYICMRKKLMGSGTRGRSNPCATCPIRRSIYASAAAHKARRSRARSRQSVSSVRIRVRIRVRIWVRFGSGYGPDSGLVAGRDEGLQRTYSSVHTEAPHIIFSSTSPTLFTGFNHWIRPCCDTYGHHRLHQANDSIYIARWPGLLARRRRSRAPTAPPTTTALIPGRSPRSWSRWWPSTRTLEHYTDMQTAAEALMPAGANYESEKNKVYPGARRDIDTALKRSWRRTAARGSDECDVPPQFLRNAMKRGLAGHQERQSPSPAGKGSGLQASIDNYISIQGLKRFLRLLDPCALCTS
jgi:hypothetical protein